MYSELAGRKALITGAARGFGKAIALRLAREGVDVVVNYRRSMSDAQAVVDEIHDMNKGRAIAVRADVGKEVALDKMFATVKEEFGSLDILVANAAFGVPGSLIGATTKHWDVTMGASARSLLDMARRAMPLMDGAGHIVSITSDGGQKVIPGYGLVGPAKSALESITRGLAVELAPQGIIVNGILAGLADTKSSRSIPGCTDVLGHAKFHTPMGRIVEPEDIAAVVAYLVSDEALMICGQFITVDGGRNIMG